MLAQPDPLHLRGTTLAGKYAIESLVRVESTSVVYRATHVRTNRSVAVRVLVALLALPESQRRSLSSALARDAAALGEIAAIVPAAHPLRDVGNVGTPEGMLPFVVLDWPHGITLAQVLKPADGRSPDSGASAAFPESLEDSVTMLEPVAVALAMAHERGVIHGGITSERILLRDDGPDGERRAALLDFGVARVLRLAQGGRTPTSTDDVRALAALLAQVMARSCGADALADDVRTPKQRGVVMDAEVDTVFARALSPDAYPSVGDFWSALRRSLGLATLRSLEQTIPPEFPSSLAPSSRAPRVVPEEDFPSRSLRPTAHSNAPPPPAARGRGQPNGYAVAALMVVALCGGVTLARVHADAGAAASSGSVAAKGSSSGRAAACDPGMLVAGGETVRLGQAGDGDDPPHQVTLHPFCIDKDAVTTAAYEACSGAGVCDAPSLTNEWSGISADDHQVLDVFCTGRDPAGRAGQPVNCVTWRMAATYCAQRGARLPTEAEWESASRSSSASIAEWASDWRAPIAGEASRDPGGPESGEERVVRGAHAVGALPTRFGAAPDTRSHAIGFRCAKSL
jgi:formylglycine-generating enzyme required for sulfatase activity